MVRMSRHPTCEDWQLPNAKVYRNETEVIITGDPPDVEDGADISAHDCDLMGCGWEHVLYRFHRRERQAK